MPNRKLFITALAAVALMVPLAAACAQTGGGQSESPEAMNDNGDTMNPQVTLQTSKGNIVLELYADKAPQTVENFLGYVRDGFYDGTIFHRVIPNFMVQGGGFTADMQQKETKDPIQNEADNGLTNDRGTIAMARTMNPHSASAQFFINTVDNAPLNHTGPSPQGWGYAVFGKVVEGMDVVDAISGVATTNRGPHQNVPAEPVVIEKATVQGDA